jgi:N-methylhydantoinase B
MHIRKDQRIRGRDSSGGGYGDPLTRDPARVLTDVLEGYESIGKARDIYGVVFTGKIEDDTLAVDAAATAARRAELAKANGASAHASS